MRHHKPRCQTRAATGQTPRLGRRQALALLAAGGAALGLGSALLGGCDSPRSTSGRPPRVVSVSPNTTEALFALGAGAMLVGRSSYCDQPQEATALPVVGGFADPSVEAIVALRPTLVVGDRGPAGPTLEQRLQAHGIDSYFPAIDSVADISAMVRGLGERLGRAQAGEELATRIEREIRRAAEAAAARPRVRAVLVLDSTPIVVAGPGGFPDEVLRLAGAANPVDRGGPYPAIGLEHLLALDPDVIVDATEVGMAARAPSGGAERSRLSEKPGWSELRAVRTGRVRMLRGSAALRPGPRIAQGLVELDQALHDEAASR
jgi:iron complex transport system substrate-binding protein